MQQGQITGQSAVLANSADAITSTQIDSYHVKLQKDEDGRFVATVDDLAGVISDGATEDEALDNVQEAMVAMLESMGTRKAFMLVASE